MTARNLYAKSPGGWITGSSIPELRTEVDSIYIHLSTLNTQMTSDTCHDDGLAHLLNTINTEKQLLTWLEMLAALSPHQSVRDFATTEITTLHQHRLARYHDQQSYARVTQLLHRVACDKNTVYQRCLEIEVLAYIHAGAELDSDAERAQVADVHTTIQALEATARLNIPITKSVYGLPAALHAFYAVALTATDDGDREQAYVQSMHHPTNVDTLAQLIQLRHDMAQLLGYRSYAAMQLQTTMAGKPKNVTHFLSEISTAFDDIYSDDMRILGHVNNMKPIQIWDIPRLFNRIMDRYGGGSQLFTPPASSAASTSASTYEPYFKTASVVAVMLVLAGRLSEPFTRVDDDDDGTASACWSHNVKRFTCASGDVYIEILTPADHQRRARSGQAPMVHPQLTVLNHYLVVHTVDMDIETPASPRAQVLIQLPAAVLTLTDIESALLCMGRALRYIHLNAGLANVLDAEADVEDLTGYILIEALWEPTVLNRLMLAATNRAPTETQIRYLQRRRELLRGLQLKFELLKCKYDLVIHTDSELINSIAIDDAHHLLLLQTRLWTDNISYKNRDKFTIQPPRTVLEAALWPDLYDHPGRAYKHLWCQIMAVDVYNTVVVNNTRLQHYRSCILRHTVALSTFEQLTKLMDREPEYNTFYDKKLYVIRGYYDRDDDEMSEQVDVGTRIQRTVVGSRHPPIQRP